MTSSEVLMALTFHTLLENSGKTWEYFKCPVQGLKYPQWLLVSGQTPRKL